MVQEAFKKQRLSSHELYQVKRWEGKPWSFKVKYFIANYPGMALGTFLTVFLTPAVAAFKLYTFNEEEAVAMRKYKLFYYVVRPDDPNISYIRYEKECGRQYFPE